MPSDPNSTNESESVKAPTSSATALEEVLEQYLEELARGSRPDPESYIRAHPELADALRGVFRTLEFVEATSQSLEPSQLRRGRRLGDFQIIREIGRGGMGVVYEAVQVSLNRRVALKVLPMGVLLAANASERFVREAATAGKLHHTNIVPIYAIGQEQGIHYYAMQFIEGRSLQDHLTRLREGRVHPGRDYYRRVARWGQQAAEALAHAHAIGTIHRDVKPSNLLLDARDNVWLTDFGLARNDALTSLTMSGDLIGTARYMSPEQARGGRVQLDGRADIYSLGATLYELLTLRPAFEGESRAEVLNRIVFADPAPLHQLNSQVPRDLETIVAKCMEKEPERRYVRAADVAEDCRRFLSDEPIRARRTPAAVRCWRFLKKHRVQAISTVVILCAMLVSLSAWKRMRTVQGEQYLKDAYDALLMENDRRRTHELLKEAAAQGIDSAQRRLCEALIPLLNNQPQLAMEELQAAQRRAPDDVEVKLALALAYTQTNDFYNRQRVMESVKDEDVDTALAWLLYGLSLSKTKQSAAVEAFGRAVALRPDFSPAISARAYHRGFRLQTEGARDELNPMLNDCDALVVFRPNSALSYANRGRGWLSAAAYAGTQPDLEGYRGTWLDNCRKDLEQALKLSRPDDSFSFVQQGVYLRFIGDFHAAEEAFARAVEIEHKYAGQADPALIHKHAMMVYALGDPAAALREIEPVCAAAPTFYPLAYQRILMLAELGRLEEARAAGREYLQRYRTHTPAFFICAAMLEFVQDAAPVGDAVREFARTAPNGLTFEDATQAAPGPIVEYFLGEATAEQLLRAVEHNPGRTCEYAFLVALRELGRGDRVKGLAALDQCARTNIFRFVDQRFAHVMLMKARQDSRWPAWIRTAP